MTTKIDSSSRDMEKKKLDSFRKKLEERQQSLRKTVSRTEEDGRIADQDSARTLPIARPIHTPKSFCFRSATMNARCSTWWNRRCSGFAKAASANASTAAVRSTPNAWKRFRGRAIASPARRRKSRDCWKMRKGRRNHSRKGKRRCESRLLFFDRNWMNDQ